MQPIHTFQDVLAHLDHIIETEAAKNSNLVYFAFLYRRVTAEIMARAQAGHFEDATRIEAFDVEFAKLYIQAWQRYQEGLPIPESSQIPFEQGHTNHTALQHLLLGMNVHINLDLGNAAALIAPGQAIHALQHDFDLVNQILTDLVDEMQLRLARISYFMFLLRWAGGKRDDAIIGWSIRKAREQAWKFALKLAPLTGPDRTQAFDAKDRKIALLAKMIAHPPGRMVRIALWLIRLTEVKNVRKALGLLEKP
jgi:hypothetical protein